MKSSEFQLKIHYCFAQVHATPKQKYFFRCLLALLFTVAVAGCHTVKPTTNSTLKDLQGHVTPEVPDQISSSHEQQQAKAAMSRWLEQYLKREYQVIDKRFVLTEPGLPKWSGLGSMAHQYVEQTLGGVLKIDGWFDDENYALLMWKIGDDSPRYIAFVRARDFLPGAHERHLVGYFELVPSAKH